MRGGRRDGTIIIRSLKAKISACLAPWTLGCPQKPSALHQPGLGLRVDNGDKWELWYRGHRGGLQVSTEEQGSLGLLRAVGAGDRSQLETTAGETWLAGCCDWPPKEGLGLPRIGQMAFHIPLCKLP